MYDMRKDEGRNEKKKKKKNGREFCLRIRLTTIILWGFSSS